VSIQVVELTYVVEEMTEREADKVVPAVERAMLVPKLAVGRLIQEPENETVSEGSTVVQQVVEGLNLGEVTLIQEPGKELVAVSRAIVQQETATMNTTVVLIVLESHSLMPLRHRNPA
jgi:hypothetical protein